MPKVFVTRKIPDNGPTMLREAGFEVDVSPKSRPLSKQELIKTLRKKQYDGVLSLLTDQIDAEVFDAAQNVKIVANYAVGFNNIDVAEAKKRGVIVTNTPGVLTESVAEHTAALILALSCRVVEGDSHVRQGKFRGWEPELLLGTDLSGKTLCILGAGRIGSRVATIMKKGFDMRVVYYDVAKNERIEQEIGAAFRQTIEEVLREADIVSIHVALTTETMHLINRERLSLMKPTAYLVNTSRGPVVDEAALVEALQKGTIAGAGLDVFEHEPKLAKGLARLSNVVLTPHIASATKEARLDMAKMAAENIIAAIEGKVPPNAVS